MSIDLDVESNLPIPFAGIEDEVATVLHELLHLDDAPDVVISSVGDDEWQVNAGDSAVRVLAVEIPFAEGADEDYRIATNVSAGHRRTPGSKALMVAAAIALARRADTAVVDDALLLSPERNIAPSRLLRSLRLAERQPSFDDAAARLADEIDHGWRVRRRT